MITEMPSVMISAFTRKIAIADPVDEADHEADAERERDRARRPRASPKRETVKAAAVAVVATERSMPPVSITSVCPAAISPSTAAIEERGRELLRRQERVPVLRAVDRCR